MKDEEKAIYELIDQHDEDQAELDLLESFEASSQPITEGDIASINRIKARTLSRIQSEEINLHPTTTASFPQFRYRQIAVVAAIFAILFAAVGATPSVQAGLKKVLQYLPGIGVVQEGDPEQLTYVLEKPYVQSIDAGKLTIDGIVLESNGATITLRGVQIPEVKEFEAEINDRTYKFKASLLSSAGDWYGTYNPERGTEVSVSDTITLYINGTTIGPLKLVQPRSADDLEHLGSTDVHEGVSVTAFPTRLDDGIVRVQMISKLPESSHAVNSYGVSPILKDSGLYVEDGDGKKAELVKSEAQSYSSDFQFYELKDGVSPYTVVIPNIEVSDREVFSKEVSIPLPEVGKKQIIDVPAEVSSFPVRFTHIRRTTETTVELDVDVQFDPLKPSALLYFMIRYPGSDYNDSFSWEHDKKNSALMKTIHLETEPDQTVLRFSLAEPHFLIKGPWRLPLDME
ncbi:hypothetical protein [Paenibacillus sp. YAF4_2]|uniref:hypothetical protein n=1 Tax=Paenibacillus sp. YAF4_2 TaxID=3233085 RepID=UPI003F9CD981